MNVRSQLQVKGLLRRQEDFFDCTKDTVDEGTFGTFTQAQKIRGK